MSCSMTTMAMRRSRSQQQLRRPLRLVRPHAGGRLVEQQQLWAAGERHADLQPLLLAVRERAGRSRHCPSASSVQISASCAHASPRAHEPRCGDAEIVAARSCCRTRWAPGTFGRCRAGEVSRCGRPVMSCPAKRSRPAVGRTRAGQHVEECALSRAVRPDDAGDALAAELKADAGDRHDPPKRALKFSASSREAAVMTAPPGSGKLPSLRTAKGSSPSGNRNTSAMKKAPMTIGHRLRL